MRKNQASYFFESFIATMVAFFEGIKVHVYEPIELFYEFLYMEW